MWAGIALDLRHVRSLYIRHIRQLVKLANWTNHSLTVLYDGLYSGFLYISSAICSIECLSIALFFWVINCKTIRIGREKHF